MAHQPIVGHSSPFGAAMHYGSSNAYAEDSADYGQRTLCGTKQQEPPSQSTVADSLRVKFDVSEVELPVCQALSFARPYPSCPHEGDQQGRASMQDCRCFRRQVYIQRSLAADRA